VTRSGRAVAALALLGGLIACSEPAPPVAACPQPAIVDGLDRLEIHLDAAVPTPETLVMRTILAGFDGSCRIDRDGARLALELDLVTVPGPAYDGRPPLIPYFVIVLDPAGTVVGEAAFEASLPTLTPQQASGVTELLEQRIAGVTPADGAAWRVLLGLEVPREEALRRRGLQ
jgi:hypothetical protein